MRARTAQLVVLALVLGSVPVLINPANASPSNFVAIDGSIVKSATTTATYDWANSGPLTITPAPPVSGSVYSRAGTGGLFNGGTFQGSTAPPLPPSLTPAAAADPSIANAAFIPVSLGGDKTACGPGVSTAFTSSSKQTDDINSYTWGTKNTISTKDQIDNVYAVSHITATANEIFFGAERVDNSGSSHVDFEFLQAPVSTNATAQGCAPAGGGTFSGHRTEGDLLVGADFGQGGTIGNIFVDRWQCGASPMPAGTVCDPPTSTSATYVPTTSTAISLAIDSGVTGTACGGWVCRDSMGSAVTTVAQNEFIEGGIDLTAAGFSTGCFSSFLPHARSSGSTSSNLEEFAGPITFSNCKQPTVSTQLSGGGQTGQSVTVTEGTSVSDTATLANTTNNPDGTVTYQVFTDPSCTVASSTPTVTQTVTLGAGGNVPSSSSFTFSTPGTYYWQASYSGSTSGHDLPAKSPCNEILTRSRKPQTRRMCRRGPRSGSPSA